MAGVGPWYPMYGSDFDAATASWPLEPVGAYVRLLNHQWDSGSVPDDLGRIAAILRVGAAKAKAVWASYLADKFPVCEDGARRNGRLAEIRREREEFIAEQTRKAGLGGNARWHARGDARGSAREYAREYARTYAPPSPSPSPSPEEGKRREDPPKGPPVGAPRARRDSRPAIPERLLVDVPGFAEMWQERMRAAGRRKPSPSAECKQLDALVKALRECGAECVIAAVEDATRGGYQGIFPEKFTRNGLRTGRGPALPHPSAKILNPGVGE